MPWRWRSPTCRSRYAGLGHIKEANVALVEARQAELLARYTAPREQRTAA